jgi:hypothetical protein
MNPTGYRSVQMLRRYIRDGNLFRDNSAGKLGFVGRLGDRKPSRN